MAPNATPFPRSLVPLPDESLPGFLLRLGHRLNLAPGFVAWRVGLAGERPMVTTARAGQLFMIEASKLQHFAQVARISPEDADRLTLRPWVNRCPPVTHALVPPKDPTATPRPLHRFPPGILVPGGRYCPECLAGDGSEIQARHGGAWLRRWRLATTFACPEHNVLLRHTCPDCHQPPGTAYRSHQLLTLPGAAGLHPAQCRNETSSGQACGQRLDDLTGHPAQGTLHDDLADLQIRLHSLLQPDTPARASFEIFADLQLLATLILATWPATAHQMSSEQAAEVNSHVTNQLRQVDALPPIRHRDQELSWTLPPRASLAVAAVLSLADRILRTPEQKRADAIGQLASTAPEKAVRRWGNTWKTLIKDSTPACREAVEAGLPWDLRPKPRLIKPRSAEWTRFRTVPYFLHVPVERLDGYSIESIPQEIPDDWFNKFHDGLAEPLIPTTRRVRRAAAIHLIQAASEMDSQQAANYLGIPADWGLLEFEDPNYRPSNPAREAEFSQGIKRLAQCASGIPIRDRIDYRARRKRFATWHLETESFFKFLDHYTAAVGRRPPAPRTRLHEALSAVIWHRLTASEYYLAPCFHPPISPAKRQTHSNSTELVLAARVDSAGYRSPYFPFQALIDQHVHGLLTAQPVKPSSSGLAN
ncbi:TniQ family protein [Kitasatospora sp. NBC_01539]|uniref:TniQ family protein n=1 Tax=Kitasatospora sp. NBC_01539 TaxID=2903577 RepID=UPI00386019B3